MEYDGYERGLASMVYKFFNKKSMEYDGYERGLASMVYKFFNKKSMGSGTVKPSSLESISSILADELHKLVIKKFNKRKVYSQFKDGE